MLILSMVSGVMWQIFAETWLGWACSAVTPHHSICHTVTTPEARSRESYVTELTLLYSQSSPLWMSSQALQW